MMPLLRSWRQALQKRPSVSRAISNRLAPTISSSTLVEEETLPFYQPQHYYPVKIGEILNTKYQTIGKLGFGAYSTVWLCRVLADNDAHNKHEYVALKISTCFRDFPDKMRQELKVYEHLSTITSVLPGQSMIRGLYDAFELESLSGRHQCLIQTPMHMSLLEMMQIRDEPLSLPVLKMTIKRLLCALDFLHTDAGVIHTDLKADNVMLTIEDQTMLTRFNDAEIDSPSPQKPVDESRTIYKSRAVPKPKDGKYGLPLLCDLGEARIGISQKSGPFVQPHIYRAPEVIFEMPWGPSVDIWNLAGLIWDLFEGQHLFGDVFDNKGQHDPFKHVAMMVGLVGPPPAEFVKRSDTTEQCFDVNGSWIANEHAEVLTTSLETREKRLQGNESKGFLNFIRSMLAWLPEERKTAKQLLQDSWLDDET